MERRDFLGTLTSPVFAACAVCMASCSKSSSGGGSGNSGSTANFTIDLSTSLLAIGSSLVQSGVIVVRIATGNTVSSFTAVQVNCTHEGTSINYNDSQGIFICPNHGSTFTKTGVVTLGPATTNLKSYNVSINGNIMTITG